MKTRDWPLFVGITPCGRYLAALTTPPQNATWIGGAGIGFRNTAGGLGPRPPILSLSNQSS